MRIRRKWLLTIISGLILALLLAGSAMAAESGTCGENLTWVLNDEGLLTISGTGPMDNWLYADNNAPWWQYKDSITSLVIDEGVTTIGEYAFNGCSNLGDVFLPSSITSIGQIAFRGIGISEIAIPKGVKVLNYDTFACCRNLVRVILPYGLERVGEQAFAECRALSEVVFPDTLKSIGWNAFQFCHSLEEVVLPRNLTQIESCAFMQCSKLTDVFVPQRISSLGTRIFEGSPNVTITGYSDTIIKTYAEESNIPFVSIDHSCSGSTNTPYGNKIDFVIYDNGEMYVMGNGRLAGSNILSGEEDTITDVNISDGITSIERSAFVNCRNLNSVLIPSSVTSIQNNTFGNNVTIRVPLCSSYAHQWAKENGISYEIMNHESIVVDSAVIATDCIETGLTEGKHCSVCNDILVAQEIIPAIGHSMMPISANDATCIEAGNSAYYICSNCGKFFSNEDGETEIAENSWIIPANGHAIMAFADKAATCTEPGYNAHWKCTICNKYFSDVEGLTEIEENFCLIPATRHNLTSYSINGIAAYWQCSACGHLYTDAEGMIEIIDYGTCGSDLTWTLDDQGTLIIDGTGNMTSHTWNVNDINQIIIREGVTSIANSAFAKCNNLMSIIIPDSVTSIGNGAFRECSNLISITIPDSVTYIGNGALSRCNSLKSITIPESITSLDGYVFYGCSSLTNVTIPNSVTNIGESAFRECSNLTSITIPNSVSNIDEYAFSNCSGLTNISIPDSVTSIGYAAFSSCNGLTSITIPNSVTSIGKVAFAGCRNLTDVTISNNVTRIDIAVFSGCSNLKSVTIPDSVKRIDERAFQDCRNLTNIIIPDSVIYIGIGAFQDCDSLTNIMIPNSLKTIDEEAFCDCNALTSIIVSSGLKSVFADAFYGCTNLSTVYYSGTEEQWNSIYLDDGNARLVDASKVFNHYNHILKKYEEEAATCIQTGTEAYWSCDVCKKLFSDEKATTEIEMPVVIPTIGHNLTATAAKDATCTEAGQSAYWTCSTCGKYFSDAAGSIAIEENEWVIAAIGHSWNDSTYVWADDNTTVTATRTCQNGDHPETEMKPTKRMLITAPTETTTGSFKWINMDFENTAFIAQEKEETIPTLSTMTVLNLPAFLTTVETEAFNGVATEAIIVPNTVTAIEPKAFTNCENLIYIKIPAGVIIPEDAFDGSPNVVIDQK